MAHHIYNTEGYILDSAPSGEANKVYTVLTKDVGVVRGKAQGVRFLKSKLRYSLQEFSHVNISLVRGKEVWRITNAHVLDTVKRPSVARIFALIKRMVSGEEQNEVLYEIVNSACAFLNTENVQPEEEKYVEYIVVLEILHNQGYLRHINEFNELLQLSWSRERLEIVKKMEKKVLQEINATLKESQL